MSKQSDENASLGLEVIAEVQAPPQPDIKAQEEEQDLERQQKAALVRGIVQDIDERKLYARRVYFLVVGWLGVIGLMLLAQGFKFRDFALSNTVLITAISTTTASIVGIFLIVANYLFPKR